MKKGLLGLLAGLLLGAGGYIIFDTVATPDGTVIEAVEGAELYSGTFSDADPAHVAGGSFVIKADGKGGRFIQLSDDFYVVNAPDPHIEINGQLIAKNKYKGGQVYFIPNTVSEDIESVHIFCKIAGIKLGLGTIN